METDRSTQVQLLSVSVSLIHSFFSFITLLLFLPALAVAKQMV